MFVMTLTCFIIFKIQPEFPSKKLNSSNAIILSCSSITISLRSGNSFRRFNPLWSAPHLKDNREFLSSSMAYFDFGAYFQEIGGFIYIRNRKCGN